MNTTYSTKLLSGQKFGRWVVLDESISTPKRERKWLCQCDCGTMRHVLQRSLLYGSSESCGCLRKERAAHALFTDMTGQTFGELTVIRQMENTGKTSGTLWLCKCSCGAEYKVLGTLLINGRRTRCPDKSHKKNYAVADITGKKFACLTALYPAKERKSKRSVTWHCRCDCGNEVDVPYNELVYCNMKSCGCRKKAHDHKLEELLIHVDGTSIDMVKSKKIPSDNTTGCRGVYLTKGKYTAKIVFQKKAYYLGCYDSIEKAAQARKEAEELLFDGTAAFYEKWKVRAEADPEWAVENPVKICVSKDNVRGLTVTYSPEEVI